jgi:hypothetical protein
LRSIGPEVIDAWLRYAAVEPEAFRVAGPSPAKRQPAAVTQMLSPSKAVELWAKRYGR